MSVTAAAYSLFLIDSFLFPGQSDLLSAAGFVAFIFFFAACAEFQFSVLLLP